MKHKPKTKKLGTVQKIIRESEKEKAEISIHDADDLYREIRIENKLETEHGEEVKLKKGVAVDVIVEADEKDTTPKE